jgi:hypothetical protein
MALELLCFLHLFTEYSLYNANSLVACIFYAQRKDIIASRFFFNVFLYIRSANVPSIVCGNICPLARTFP